MTVEIIEEIQKRTESRISAWWSAWKYVAILGLLLVVSVGVNLRQWSDHRGYVRAQAAELKAAAAQAGLKVAVVIATQKAKDDPKLQNAVSRIEARVNKIASQQRPPVLPIQCAPGKVRMDAVNEGADR